MRGDQPEFPGEAAVERLQRRLGHVVGGARIPDDAVGAAGADGDDAAAGLQVRDRRLGREDGRAHVHRQQGVDVLLADLGERGVADDGGVVDQDVETAQGGDRLLHRPLHRRHVGAVGLDGEPLAPLGLDGLHDLRGPVVRPFVGDRHVRALFGEFQSDGGADAAGSARHQGALASQVRHFLRSPFFLK